MEVYASPIVTALYTYCWNGVGLNGRGEIIEHMSFFLGSSVGRASETRGWSEEDPIRGSKQILFD